MNKDNKVYLTHIFDAIDKIEKYTEGKNSKEFMSNSMVQDAVIRQIEIIGEAAKRVSSTIRKSNPKIPWKDIAGMRDKLIHGYFGVDLDAVWETVKKDVPVLKQQVADIMKKYNGDFE